MQQNKLVHLKHSGNDYFTFNKNKALKPSIKFVSPVAYQNRFFLCNVTSFLYQNPLKSRINVLCTKKIIVHLYLKHNR